MLSVVVVCNSQRALDQILLPSLRDQTAEFEFLPVDNTKGQFRSAAQALNSGGTQAQGKYIMFVHQDVELGSTSWLEDAERILDAIPDLGVAGVAGMAEKGESYSARMRGHISDCGEIWGSPLEKPEEVQTLDECLLIVPRRVFAGLQFDERTFDGWHCYGVDFCLSVRQTGLKAYAVPAFVYHRSLRRNAEHLLRYHHRLYNKHRQNYTRIYTTCGEISWLRLRLRSLIEVLLPLYERLFPGLVEDLTRELAGCQSVLDLGCGYGSPLHYCAVPFSVGVELFEPYLQETRKKAIHSQYIKADIRKLELKARSFDAVIALDVLEHLTKQQGTGLIRRMEDWARKKVIVLTPNGLLCRGCCDGDPLQQHRSGWRVGELRAAGYKVYGINGWEKLRGHRTSIKYRPAFLWARICDLTQKITYYHPALAFQLLAVKEIKSSERE